MPHNAFHTAADASTNGVPGWLTGAYDAVTPSEALNRWYGQVAQQPGLAGPYADLLRQRGPNLLSRYFTYGPQGVGEPGYDFIDFAKGVTPAGERLMSSWGTPRGGGNISQEDYARALRDQAGRFDVSPDNMDRNMEMRRDYFANPANAYRAVSDFATRDRGLWAPYIQQTLRNLYEREGGADMEGSFLKAAQGAGIF